MRINVDFDYSQVVHWADTVGNSIADMAKASALNKVIEKTRTRTVRAVSRKYNVSAAYVRDRLQIRRASASAKRFVMEATLAAIAPGNRRAANLIRFAETTISMAAARKRMAAGEGGRQTLRSGGQVTKALEIRFKIKRVGPKKVIKGAFIGNKGRTVFIREGTDRLPIKALSTIDVPQMFNARDILSEIVQPIPGELQAALEHELQYYLDRYS